MRLDLDEINLG